MSIHPSVRSLRSPCPAGALRRHGFTLIELLVVITIIGILSAVVLSAVNGNDEIQSVNAGVNRASGLFNLARSAAITRKTPIRVLVQFDPADQNRFLRYMIPLYLDTTVTPNAWKVYSDGEFLPPGVFFSPALSSTDAVPLSIWTVRIDPNSLVVTPPVGNPVVQSHYNFAASGDALTHGPGIERWYAFEFNANGTMAKPGSRFVVTKGILGSSPPAIRVPRPELMGGFTVFRAGRTLHFQDPRQITGGL